jgi:hypothetical protein
MFVCFKIFIFRKLKKKFHVFLKRVPFILRGFDIGICKEKWIPNYLQTINKLVKVHVCADEKMDFIHKNFLYK